MKRMTYVTALTIMLALALHPLAFSLQKGERRIRTIKADEVNNLIENFADGKEQVVKTRVFSNGEMLENPGEAVEVTREEATFHPIERSLVVTGTLNGVSVIEDLRFIEFDNKFYVLRDVYLDGKASDLGLGRSTPAPLESSGDGSPEIETMAASATSAPRITSLGGVSNFDAGITNGRVDMSCGSRWNTGMVINDQPGIYPWYINGSNFGTARGRVTVAGRDAVIASNGWSATRIIASPTTYRYNAEPAGPVLLTVYTATGNANYGINVVPAIRSRIYGQCTWFVALTRLNMGKQPSPTAYGGYTTITPQYVPQVGDQLAWRGRHTAIITAVRGPSTQSGGYKTWNVTVEEFNWDCRNNWHAYTSDFQVRTVNGQTAITKYIQSSINGYGSATVYYR